MGYEQGTADLTVMGVGYASFLLACCLRPRNAGTLEMERRFAD
jgi:hypothetical protein